MYLIVFHPPCPLSFTKTFLMNPPAPAQARTRESCHFLLPAKCAELQKTACLHRMSARRAAGSPLSSSLCLLSRHENVSRLTFSMGSSGPSKKRVRYPRCLLPIDGLFTQLVAAATAFLGPGGWPIASLHRLCDKKSLSSQEVAVCREKVPQVRQLTHLA